MAIYRRIVVPLDASSLDERVLDTALATAAWSGAELVLLHVMAAPASLRPGEANVELNVIDRQIDEMVAKARLRAPDQALPERSAIRAEVRAGSVVDAIATAVTELHADLVIMGTHGRSGVLEAFTGSTTEQTMRRVPASIFIVRPEGFPFLTE